jgi:hypothetical protein
MNLIGMQSTRTHCVILLNIHSLPPNCSGCFSFPFKIAGVNSSYFSPALARLELVLLMAQMGRFEHHPFGGFQSWMGNKRSSFMDKAMNK